MKLIKRFLDGGKYVNVPLWSLDPMKRSEINNYMESQGLNPNSLSQLLAFTDTPTSMLEGGEVLKKFQASSPRTPYNRGGYSNTIHQVPPITVKGIDRRWRFDRRENPQGNGRSTISETLFDYYNGGNYYLGDNSVIRGGRTIYTSPKGNDTIYWKQPVDWIEYPNGLMPIGNNLPGAKENFFKNLKRPLIKHQLGGPVEKADNTKVASGRPLLIKNKIPYGAGKGPAGEGPMRLFNDPYINMGLMAMAPMAVRQHRNGVNYAPPTMKDIINNIKSTGQHGLPVNPEVGISLNSLMKYTGKSPEQINSIMLPKYGDMRIETLPNSKRQLGIWRIKGDKDLVLNEVLELLK